MSMSQVERNRKYCEANREKVNSAKREHYHKNKEKVILYDRKYKYRVSYGLTVAEAEEIYSRGCAICGTLEGKLCIDHNHETGKVRDCLCQNCNLILGHAKDSPDRLEKAAQYLRSHNDCSL